MAMSREERVTRKYSHTKQERLQVKSGVPEVSQMREGVPVLRSTFKGVLEYIRYNNVLWWRDFTRDGNEYVEKDLEVTGDATVRNNLTVNGNSTINGDVTVEENKKIYFDSTDTYIYANTDNPEDLVIGSDADIILEPDEGVGIGQSAPVSANGASSFLYIGSSAVTISSLIIEDNGNIWEIMSNNHLIIKDGTTARFKIDASTGDSYTNDGTISSLSDIRIKKDVQDLSDGLNIVNQLKPRTFKYNGRGETGDDDRIRYGFIADEVLDVASHYVNIEDGIIDGIEVNDFKSLSTTRMIPMLVKAIQELTSRVVELENV
jgi:hypothetical protein